MYRAAGNEMINAFGVEASGAEGRHLARLKSAEAARALGLPESTSKRAADSLFEVIDLINELEAMGWETVDSQRGGIRVRLTARATAFAAEHASGKDLVIVWTQEGRWAWGTAEFNTDPAKVTELDTSGARRTGEAIDALLRRAVT